MLVTVLGDLLEPFGDRPVRTAALVYVLQGLGYGEHAARQAIVRTGASGLLTPTRSGRETLWALTDPAHRLFTEGDIRGFSTDIDSTRWDGHWLVVCVSIPESQRSARNRLYAALRWIGLGNPAPGVWVTPHHRRAAEVSRTIDELRLTESTLSFVGELPIPGVSQDRLVRRSWDLAAAEQAYDDLLQRFDGRRFAPGDEQLFAHLELADGLRRMASMDPRLPEVLLPEWRGLEAARRLRELRTELTPGAHARWREISGL
ncbi:PaaX family transcriptional regulator C-terminal domain-containing protein [Gordonia sp. (in: high G+C Gram-positive bacteria)]|uniref:PaaX family transcriptional regulator n=1 Tax=Gordonia sp. (in: high G+C Gram-positive bacteria) TaxID=84139 RepID=UPI003528011C